MLTIQDKASQFYTISPKDEWSSKSRQQKYKEDRGEDDKHL